MPWLATPDFSLRQLQYAAAVAETGGFGRAAGVCGVSQPALSAQIAKLEEGLGVQLFERHARGVRLTGAGRALLERLHHVLDAGRALDHAAIALRDPFAAVLRVGVIPTIAPYLVPPVVELLRGREPAPRVHWLELQTAHCEAALDAGELDAMWIADRPSRPSVDQVELGWEPFFAVVPAEDGPEPLTREDLATRDLLLLDDGHCLRDHALALCMLPGATESPYRGTSLTTLVQMVGSGMGVTVVPASAVALEVGRAEVRAVPLEPSSAGRTQRMCWRSRTARGTALRVLAGAAREALAASIGS